MEFDSVVVACIASFVPWNVRLQLRLVCNLFRDTIDNHASVWGLEGSAPLKRKYRDSTLFDCKQPHWDFKHPFLNEILHLEKYATMDQFCTGAPTLIRILFASQDRPLAALHKPIIVEEGKERTTARKSLKSYVMYFVEKQGGK